VTDTVSRNPADPGVSRVIGDVNRFVYATPLIYDNQPVGAGRGVPRTRSHLNRIEWGTAGANNAIRFLVLAAVISIIAAARGGR